MRLLRLAEHFQTYENNLRTLKLHFLPPEDFMLEEYGEGHSMPETWHVDMSILERFGSSLDRVAWLWRRTM